MHYFVFAALVLGLLIDLPPAYIGLSIVFAAFLIYLIG